MKVELIAKTRLTDCENPIPEWRTEASSDGEALIEFAGRNCYQSWNNPAGRTNAEYVKNIIKQEHFSVLEHASVTFFITGVSRSWSHEIIRHRHLSFSELSQRYVNVEEAPLITPPLLSDSDCLSSFADGIQAVYKTIYNAAAARAHQRKRIREAARSVMPNCTETKMVVSGNLRAWRDVLEKRGAEPADLEMREWAVKTFEILNEEYPAVFSDFVQYQADDGFLALERKLIE